MKMIEYLLVKLSEECAEVSQRATKAICFGLDEAQPGQERDNAYRLLDELEDLQVIHDMLMQSGYFHKAHDAFMVNGMDRRTRKREKVKKFIEYSRSLGVVTGGYYDGNNPSDGCNCSQMGGEHGPACPALTKEDAEKLYGVMR